MNQTIIGRIHNGHVLGVAAFLAPPLSVFAPLGFAPLFIVTAIAALVTRRLGAGAWPSAPLPFSILLVAILGWSLLSLGWAIETGVAFQALWRLVLIFVGGVVIVDAARHLMPEERDIFDRLICAGFLLGLALMALERFAHGPLFHLFNTSPPDEDFPLVVLNRGATVLALMIWPVAIAIWQRSSTAAIALWLVTFALLLTLPSGAAIAAMAVGGVAFFAIYAARRYGFAIGAAVIGAVILLSPLTPGLLPSPESFKNPESITSILPRSAYHRILTWNFAVKHIVERPILGWGLNASRVMPGREELLDKSEPALPLHPHNAALQWWLELGLPGGLLGAAIPVWLILSIRRLPTSRLNKGVCVALVFAAATNALVSYGIWQSWWLATLWLAAGFCIAALGPAIGHGGAAQARADTAFEPKP